MKRVLGIDCGTAIVGWEVLEMTNNRFVHIDGGVIVTPKEDVMSLRLKNIYLELIVIIQKFKPTDMAVEEIYYFKNNKTIISVSEARGVILLAGEVNNLIIAGYTPLQVKMAVTGYGKADKKQVQFMTKRLLNLKKDPEPDDWADAIAIAICHFNTTR
jgi:crossover junction endodeoxyribonuclease RuvC